MERGTLYLVGTPIGNLGDLSPRAAETLRTVDRIAAEDTRRTGALLQKIGSRVPTISFYARNEERRVPELIRFLREGRSLAVVSDAGNPGIADPAERLVRELFESPREDEASLPHRPLLDHVDHLHLRRRSLLDPLGKHQETELPRESPVERLQRRQQLLAERADDFARARPRAHRAVDRRSPALPDSPAKSGAAMV